MKQTYWVQYKTTSTPHTKQFAMHANKLINSQLSSSLLCMLTSLLTPKFLPLSPLCKPPASQPDPVLWKHKKGGKNNVQDWEKTNWDEDQKQLHVQEWQRWSSSAVIKENYFNNWQTGFVAWCYAHTTWNLLTQQTKAAKMWRRNKLSDLDNFKLLIRRRRRKGRLCKMSTQSHSQTHLHLPHRF